MGLVFMVSVDAALFFAIVSSVVGLVWRTASVRNELDRLIHRSNVELREAIVALERGLRTNVSQRIDSCEDKIHALEKDVESRIGFASKTSEVLLTKIDYVGVELKELKDVINGIWENHK